MAGTPVWRASDEAVFHRIIGRGQAWFAVAIPMVLIGGVMLARASGLIAPDHALAAAAQSAEPAAMLATAADQLEAVTAKGGSGYTFEIVQRSTMHAQAGGPQIEIPDPADPHKSLGFADTYELGALIERGAVTPAGFSMEMRTGPAPGKPADWTAPYQFGAIVNAGKTYRDDGAGWYPTSSPPGIGLDPATAALLPSLLRNATGVADAGTTDVNGTILAAVSGSSKVADIPGIVAVDGAGFTELVAPLDFAFDDLGRLVQLHSLARNTNLKEYDLLVDTVITFAYPTAAPDLPDPSPARPASAGVQN